MVGVPRSTGCNLCVKRRVKCDQGRPGCGNCAKYGSPCPGYERGIKFVEGKHRVRARRSPGEGTGILSGATLLGGPQFFSDPNSWEMALRASPSDSDDTPDGSGVSTNGSSCASGNGSGSGSGAGSSAGNSPPDWGVTTAVTKMLFRPDPVAGPALSKSQFVGTLMNDLKVATPMTEGIFFDHFITAEYLGRKDVLDNAISAFTAQALGKANQDQALLVQSRIMYGRTLTQLQKALHHPTEWRSAETLCSTMMCCIFELFAGTQNPDSWMEHAGGVMSLIQARGPNGYTSAWERSMFLSFRSLIIMKSLFTLENCFLARKRWQRLLLDLAIAGENDPPDVKYEKVMNLWVAHLARVPGILREGYALKESNDRGLPIDIAQVMALTTRTEALRADCAACFEKIKTVCPTPTEIPSTEPASPYDTVLTYLNPWFGSIYLGYWATMLILQETLNQCRWPIDYSGLNREFAVNIYRSLETVSQGIMGPFRVGYSMRISYSFADVRIQRWILTLAERFEKTYAATTAKTYPKVEPNSYNYI